MICIKFNPLVNSKVSGKRGRCKFYGCIVDASNCKKGEESKKVPCFKYEAKDGK